MAAPIAFYAPLKSPDHPQPSGDRTMAQLLLRALEQAGLVPEIASRLRTWEPAGDDTAQRTIRAASLTDAERLASFYEALSAHERPRLWFTYHCYYKAPDHLGPEVARRLGIPYVIAEASRAPKRTSGPYAFAHAAAESAIDRADILFVLTEHDHACLQPAIRPGQRLVRLPPFVETAGLFTPESRSDHRAQPRLLAVAMMRQGDKLASYQLLGEALAHIRHLPWTMDIVGDGPARPEVERIFAPFGARVSLAGTQEAGALARLYDSADLLVWPAVNEAFGMVLLEAQARGCPVVAGRYGGVPDVVQDGVTGILTPAGDATSFAAAIANLLADPVRRVEMSAAARHFVMTDRSLGGAACILREALGPLLEIPAAA
jgi:glycosyltransferase involved in cell wall biosynthesis